ncbi:MAG: hypothetical protein JXA09_06895 [Anaerolineae bacterium]|nr:hypothetical protein [Anaerolineae bacterium]
MSTEQRQIVPENTRVAFKLQNRFPVFREEYVAEGVGTVTLTGLFNQRAHIEVAGGARYRTLGARKRSAFPTELIYPLVDVPGKEEVCALHTPLRFESGGMPQLRFWTTLDDEQYVFRQITAGRRGFELWDAMEMNKLVNREVSAKLMPDLSVLYPVPALLILLFPWLDSQTIMHHPR